MEETQKRQVAKKVRISEILEGSYVKGEGWEPHYVLTKEGQRASRVNIIAALVSIQQGTPNNSYIIDDGTGTIVLRPFEEIPRLKSTEIGEIINVIGKPREFGSERYIVPEIIKTVKEKGWVKVRQSELELGQPVAREEAGIPKKEEAPVDIESIEDAPTIKENPFQKVYGLIKKLDSGEGALVEDIIKEADLHNTEEIVGELLKEGEIFEIKSGRLKVLE